MSDMLGKQHAYYRLGPEKYAQRSRMLMAHVDALPREARLLVHEYGSKVVLSRLNSGWPIPRIAQDLAQIRAKRMHQTYLESFDLDL